MWARRLPRWMKILRIPADLAKEGREMDHCVGGYVRAVERGQRLSCRWPRARGAARRRNEKLLRAFLARMEKKGPDEKRA